jgi:acetyl-CoA carboxylase carboxyl transferase subunit alpha
LPYYNPAMPIQTLDFEQPIADIESQIDALKSRPDATAYADEVASLTSARDSMLGKIYGSLSAWQTVKVARHPQRPQSQDYIAMIVRNFCELHGDRRFGDDPAIVTGFGSIGTVKCMVIGHRKGKTTAERLACHFGCAHPEGYRKALLKMQMAEKFRRPIVTFIDTPGAYPGIGAEQRGQAEAIAFNLREMSRLRVPIVSIVMGEGGSGGALGIGVADKIGMLEHSWYSVISPEGCAAILWKSANEQTNNAAAQALALTARQNLANGLIDEIITEPAGGAHRDPKSMAERLQTWVVDSIRELERLKPEALIRRRYEKFRKMGAVG